LDLLSSAQVLCVLYTIVYTFKRQR